MFYCATFVLVHVKRTCINDFQSCGKSTALQLLLRFYRVSSGDVEVDGKNVTELNIGCLRDHIGYVGQMPVLFAGSIRDNIQVSSICK